MSRAPFITFEGGEASGKSTQIRLLGEALVNAGKSVSLTREPGGTSASEKIRDLLLHGNLGTLDGLTEVMLLSAARREHLAQVILPKTKSGTWVLCDRFADSTMAYQGYGLGIDAQKIQEIYNVIAGSFTPDLTFIFTTPRSVSLERLQSRGNPEDRYESKQDDFHQRVEQGFLEIALGNPARCVVVDATQSIEDIHQVILTTVLDRLQKQ